MRQRIQPEACFSLSVKVNTSILKNEGMHSPHALFLNLANTFFNTLLLA